MINEDIIKMPCTFFFLDLFNSINYQYVSLIIIIVVVIKYNLHKVHVIHCQLG